MTLCFGSHHLALLQYSQHYSSGQVPQAAAIICKDKGRPTEMIRMDGALEEHPGGPHGNVAMSPPCGHMYIHVAECAQ